MKIFRFKTIFSILGVISVLCLLSPFVIGLISANLTYDGNCYGFTDGSAPCSWWQYAQNEMQWGLLLAFSPFSFLLIAWLAMLGFWFAQRRRPAGSRIPLWQAILIMLAAMVVGILLVSVIPFATGLRR